VASALPSQTVVQPLPEQAAPITLTSSMAEWIPPWALRGQPLSADSAVPGWMAAAQGAHGSEAYGNWR
jgi:hypothetical protein